MPRRLLLITYAFPSMQAPESYLAAKALSNLKSFEVDVLTIDPTGLGLPQDQSLDDFVSANFPNVYRVRQPRWLSQRLFGWLRYVSAFPDRFRILNPSMVRASLGLNLHKYDVIMSWSQWHSIHLVASKIKRRLPSIPWVVHLSDPWADNPFLPRIPGFSAIQRLMERGVLRLADAIHFTTNESRDLVMRNYPITWAGKAHVMPHAYAPELYPVHAHAGSGTKVIRYLGNFYGPRNPRNLALALVELQKTAPELLVGLSFELVGRWIGNPDWRPEHEGVADDLLKFRAPVSYRESLRLMREAAMLLILDAPFEVSVFFPSKLVDYIGASRPILAFTPEGACAEVVQKLGGIVASPASVPSILDGLKVAIKLIKSDDAPYPDPNMSKEYSATCVGKKLDDLLQKLCKEA